MELHGRGTVREDAEARAVRMALEVHEDVERVGCNDPCGRRIVLRLHVAPMVERGDEPPAHRAAVVAVVRVREGLDAGAIVAFEEARREMRSRVVVEVGR